LEVSRWPDHWTRSDRAQAVGNGLGRVRRCSHGPGLPGELHDTLIIR
jgi:hypothetical protein